MNDPTGFQFPGRFELSAMGAADADLENALPALIEALGMNVDRASLRVRASSAGRYVSVSIHFEAQSRADYDAAHSTLRAHPGVKWTL
jgi:putative lipoic acid-binding regulatory protein